MNKPLDRDVRTMIDVYRKQDRPSRTDVETVWQEVERALHLPPIDPTHGHGPSHAMQSGVAAAPKLGASAKLWLALGLGLGLAGGGLGLWRARSLSSPLPQPNGHETRAAAPVPRPQDEPTRSDPPSEPADDHGSTPVVRSVRTAEVASAPRSTERRLIEERRRLDDARAALTRRDASSALVAIEDHQRRYPSGLLSEERDSLRVQALAMAHDEARARSAADAFSRRFPNSMYAAAVERALQSLK